MPTTLADLLRQAAERRNLRLADLAEALRLHGVEVASSTIGCWMTGARTPQARHLACMVDVLALDQDERDLAWSLLRQGDPA